MSLADELLADLEDDGGYDDTNLFSGSHSGETSYSKFNPGGEESMAIDQKISIRNLAAIRDSDELKKIMVEIEKRTDQQVNFIEADSLDGPVESHPEYKLIVEANNP